MADWTDVDERIIDVVELEERGSRFWDTDFDPSDYIWLDDEHPQSFADPYESIWAGVY